MLYFPSLETILSHITDLTAQSDAAPTILIDGPSGSGKTTLATAIHEHWLESAPLQVVHMDDIYPGWNGLAQGVLTAGRMLRERSSGMDTTWQQYDWNTQSLTSWNTIYADVPLLLEGCGSLPQGAQHAAHVRIWLDADATVRHERALSRVGENFAEHWNGWDAQFAEYVRIHNPQAKATLVVLSNE